MSEKNMTPMKYKKSDKVICRWYDGMITTGTVLGLFRYNTENMPTYEVDTYHSSGQHYGKVVFAECNMKPMDDDFINENGAVSPVSIKNAHEIHWGCSAGYLWK